MNLSTLSMELYSKLTVTLQRVVTLAQEKGASSRLTAIPVQEHGSYLNKTAFWDAFALRYGWMLSHTPSYCACGTSISVDHALPCLKGGFPSIHHNEVRDITADYLLKCAMMWRLSLICSPYKWWKFQQKTRKHSGWCTFRHCYEWLLGWSLWKMLYRHQSV